MKRFFFALAVLLLISHPTSARPVSSSASIVAVANDEAITSSDLDARLKFIFATTNLSSSPESVARLRPQIIRALVDEHLQMQEGRKNDIRLTDKEIEQAVSAIEAQRGIQPGGILNMLSKQRIPESTFYQQVKAQIVWGKLLARKVRSQIKIEESEVDQMVKKMSVPKVKQEMLIALLQLPVDSPKRDKEVRAAAEKLVVEVRGGADFEELSRQFAGGAALVDGKLPSFWVRSEQLDPVIAQTLQGAKKGDISAPIRNSLGYTIIKVYDTRDLPSEQPTDTEITFKEITLRLRSSSDEKDMEVLKTIADEIGKHPGACSEESVAGIENAEFAAIDVSRNVAMYSDLTPALRVLADGLRQEEISTPFASDEGVKLYQLCGKREGVVAPVDRERARQAVYANHMELEAQRYMRNLRRDAFIEIRQ